MLTLAVFAIMIAGGLYLRKVLRGEDEPRPQLTDDQIKQQWRKLGFFCELDDQKKVWTLTGSRAGLLYFPDLLLGYTNDPENATDGAHKRYGPYGSLQIMTWQEPAFGGNSIRGSLVDLARLAEIVEAKLATAQPGEPIEIREEYSPDSPYRLVLDVRADLFDPASTDREHLGATIVPAAKPAAGPSK
ncbi:MAG: hypothetical protein ACJ8AE_10420 [Gemmatimonadaceae bacterium]